MATTPTPLQEKLTLFWHGKVAHFGDAPGLGRAPRAAVILSSCL